MSRPKRFFTRMILFLAAVVVGILVVLFSFVWHVGSAFVLGAR